jgi:hypothetical protein
VAVSDVGYIDSALIRNVFRLRYDAAFEDNRPDRAEFFYPKCGCFPGAPGPRLAETSVDYKDISAYTEVALSTNFSAFVEVPYRFLNPEQNAHVNGFSDFNAGFKYALWQDCDRVATFQFRTYFPTGQADVGLGTDHVSLEPALLYYGHLSDRLTLEAELRDWIPVGGTEFEGNVLRYGVGLGYTVYRSCDCRITPVGELVGWTVLSGKEFVPNLTNLTPSGMLGTVQQNAAGETIVNAKVGVRLWLGENNSLYAGYGRALTGTVWYKDIFRLEYRLTF